ncbi:MAG TPA: hypothetical protein VGI39_04660 [Polyangiaceae bacterium]
MTGTLPADLTSTVQIGLDRLLHPASVTRQSFALRDVAGNYLQPVVTYDPVARVVTLQNNATGPTGAWLQAGTSYEVVMGVAKSDDWAGLGGPRAIDGATLSAQVVKTFQAVAATTATSSPDRLVDFCSDVLPVFQYRCSASSCHGAPQGSMPAEGLVLQTANGIANTVFSSAGTRVAQESNTGGAAGTGHPQGRPFGVDMALITPGDPGSSYLLYKVLLGQVRPVDQGLDAGVPTCGAASLPAPVAQTTLPQPSLTLPDDEQTRLSQYILGDQMPFPLNLPANYPTPVGPPDDESATLPMTFDELERLRAWIAQGARLEQCPACPE